MVEFDDAGKAISIEEKPQHPSRAMPSPASISTTIDVVNLRRRSSPRARGELEITDLNRLYLEAGKLKVQVMSRGMAWLDTGTHDSLFEAGLSSRPSNGDRD